MNPNRLVSTTVITLYTIQLITDSLAEFSANGVPEKFFAPEIFWFSKQIYVEQNLQANIILCAYSLFYFYLEFTLVSLRHNTKPANIGV